MAKGLEKYEFKASDLTAIKELVAKKYATFEWNVGRSPTGANEFEDKFDFGTLKINFDTVDGKIQNARLTGDFFCLKPTSEFEKLLNGVPFDTKSLSSVFNLLGDYIVNADGKQVLDKLFLS